MAECNCPYCDEEVDCSNLELYEDDQSTETECRKCGKTIMVVASVEITYDAKCRDEDHEWASSKHVQGYETCSRCHGGWRKVKGGDA